MVNIFGKIWQEFVYGGHLLSIGAACLAWSAGIILGKSFSIELFAIAYFISQVIYSFDHYKDIKKDAQGHSERADYLSRQQRQAPFLLAFYIVALAVLVGITKNVAVITFVLIFLIGGVLFTLIFKGFTRKILGFKNFYTAFFWAAGSAFLPFFYYKCSIGTVFYFYFIFVFLRWVINVIFFDFKDEESDKAQKLKTFPVILGREGTIDFLEKINYLCLVPLIWGVWAKGLPVWTVGLASLFFYSACYLKKARKADQASVKKISYVMVDGEYILWPFILLLGKYLVTFI